MGTLVSIIIISLFLAIIFVSWELGRPIKKLIGKRPSQFVKPFDCIPCMSFWFSIIACIVWHFIIMPLFPLTVVVSITGAFVAAYSIQRK